MPHKNQELKWTYIYEIVQPTCDKYLRHGKQKHQSSSICSKKEFAVIFPTDMDLIDHWSRLLSHL